jgi:hypothetical protein
MDRRVRGRRNAPATVDQLRAALLEEWDNIPMRRINALMNSMHRRIRAVTGGDKIILKGKRNAGSTF